MFFIKKNILISFLKNLIIDYPSSKNLSYKWNMGSFLGMIMSVQLFSGILLILFYVPSENEAFLSIDFMTRENIMGFFIRIFHLNGASFIFVFLYLHIMRGLYFFSFRLFNTWGVGSTILLLCMMAAFLGYVLPFGQMSFWGATVITNFLGVIPIVGTKIVMWIWGGFCISKASISLFFLLHFLVPFIIIFLVFFHLIFLHETSSTSKIMIQESYTKVKFYPFFIYKDILNIFFIILMYSFSMFIPWKMGDPENWIKANAMISPVYIQPEWYFLYAYAILRCIPSKLGGVIALVLSVFILYFILFNFCYKIKIKKISYLFFFFLSFSFFILTWLGGCPVEEPYIFMSQIFSFLYFFSFIFLFF